MERYIGLDVHTTSCTLAVISETGRKLRTSRSRPTARPWSKQCE